MKHPRVLEPFGMSEFYADGLSNFYLANGILRCAPFSNQQAPGNRTQQIAIFRLIIPAAGARASFQAAISALGGDPPNLIHVLK